MLNRRDVLKYGFSLSALFAAPGFVKASTTKHYPKTFEKVFQPINFKKGETPEFPLDFSGSVGFNYYKKPEKFMEYDYILVPTPFDKKNPAKDHDYGSILLHAGIDRNMLVYDKCNENYVSKNLQILLNDVLQQYSGRTTNNKLTDIFIHENAVVQDGLNNINIHRVIDSVWNNVIANYKDFAEVCKLNTYLNNKKHIIIGVSTIIPVFIKPIMYNGDHGMSVLDNRNIILGAY